MTLIAALGGVQRGVQPGVAAADDDDIGAMLAFELWRGRERIGGGGIVRPRHARVAWSSKFTLTPSAKMVALP